MRDSTITVTTITIITVEEPWETVFWSQEGCTRTVRAGSGDSFLGRPVTQWALRVGTSTHARTRILTKMKIGHETGLEKASGALVKPTNKKKGVFGNELGPEA